MPFVGYVSPTGGYLPLEMLEADSLEEAAEALASAVARSAWAHGEPEPDCEALSAKFAQELEEEGVAAYEAYGYVHEMEEVR